MQHDFNKLDVYNRSVDLACQIVELSERILSKRLSEQLLGSAVSIASNIAEGAYRGTNRQFIQFLYYANGSVAELTAQLSILQKSNKYSEIPYDSLIDESKQISKMIFALIRNMRSRPN